MFKRDHLLDFLKGIAIILVVIGHCIQYSYETFDDILVFRIIYSFHMPLFMFLAGESARKSFDKNRDVNINKKALVLILPFLSWYILPKLFSGQNIGWFEYMQQIIMKADRGLWFLWVLYLNYFTLWVFTKISKLFPEIDKNIFVEKASLIGLMFMMVTKDFWGTEILGIRMYQKYCIWFLLGFCLFSKIKKKLILNVNSKLNYYQVGSVLLFFILVMGWNRAGEPFFIDELHKIANNFMIEKGILYLYEYIVPSFGIFATLILATRFYHKCTIKEQIIYLGRNTLGIYAIHMYLIIKTNFFGSDFIDIIVKTIIAIIFSLVFITILRQSEKLKLIFLGETSNKIKE